MQGKAQGKARQGKARQGTARHGKARQGMAWHGMAWQGKARPLDLHQVEACRRGGLERVWSVAAGRMGPETGGPRKASRRSGTIPACVSVGLGLRAGSGWSVAAEKRPVGPWIASHHWCGMGQGQGQG